MNISVIITTYKRPTMLEESVRSVWGQTRLPCEILIGDDSPDADTEKLVATVLQPQSPVPIRYFHNSPSMGEGHNVDRLYLEARGDAILHMHDDDPVYPNCIEVLAEPLEKHEEIAASFGLQHIIDEAGNLIPEPAAVNGDYFRTSDRAGRVDGLLAGAIGMFPNNGFLVRTGLARRVGYDDDGWSGYARDFSFAFRLGKLGAPVFFTHEVVSTCRMTMNSESRGNPSADNAYRVFKILQDALPEEMLARPEVIATLRRLAPLAVTIAARRKERALALQWLFGRHYRYAVLSPRWLKRFLETITA
jgi:GT2 family glycosyltransferase